MESAAFGQPARGETPREPPQRQELGQALSAVGRMLLAFNLIALPVMVAAVLATRIRLRDLLSRWAVELSWPTRLVTELSSAWLMIGAAALGAILIVIQLRLKRPDRVVRLQVAFALLLVSAWSAYVGLALVSLLDVIEPLSAN